MIFLLLTIVSAVLIAAILRFNEDRGGDRFVVAGCNYILATILCLFFTDTAGSFGDVGIVFAVLVGFGFVSGFVALMRAIKEIGLAVPATAARLSTLIPVLGSMMLYREMPTSIQIAGIAVGIAAFVVLGMAQRRHQRQSSFSSTGLWLLVAAFLISGCVDFSMKVAHESGAAAGPFLAVVFTTACLVCVVAVALRRTRPRLPDAAMGALLGIPNFSASYFLLRALEELPGVVVFPAMNAAVVLGVTAVAIVAWREIPRPATAIGLGLAACALVLLGLG